MDLDRRAMDGCGTCLSTQVGSQKGHVGGNGLWRPGRQLAEERGDVLDPCRLVLLHLRVDGRVHPGDLLEQGEGDHVALQSGGNEEGFVASSRNGAGAEGGGGGANGWTCLEAGLGEDGELGQGYRRVLLLVEDVDERRAGGLQLAKPDCAGRHDEERGGLDVLLLHAVLVADRVVSRAQHGAQQGLLH